MQPAQIFISERLRNWPKVTQFLNLKSQMFSLCHASCHLTWEIDMNVHTEVNVSMEGWTLSLGQKTRQEDYWGSLASSLIKLW